MSEERKQEGQAQLNVGATTAVLDVGQASPPQEIAGSKKLDAKMSTVEHGQGDHGEDIEQKEGDKQTGELDDKSKLSENDKKRSRPTLWWHVNKGGFPVVDDTWERMWSHVIDVHPNGREIASNIRQAETLPSVRYPCPPVVRHSIPVCDQLRQVQGYIDKLKYNHTGTQFFDIPKNRSIASLMEKAKEMLSASLPIKCLEAVVLSLYLTRNIHDLDRFVISFKSEMRPHTHKHVVLGLYHFGSFGALGLSRRNTLMYKPMVYTSLCELIEDFRRAYTECHHRLLSVKLSDVVPCDERSREQITWKHVAIKLDDHRGDELSPRARQKLTNFSRQLRCKARLMQRDSILRQRTQNTAEV